MSKNSKDKESSSRINMRDNPEDILAALGLESQEEPPFVLGLNDPSRIPSGLNEPSSTPSGLNDLSRIPSPDYGTPPPSPGYNESNASSSDIFEHSDEELQQQSDNLKQTSKNDESDVICLGPPAKIPKIDMRNRGKPMDAAWNEFHRPKELKSTLVKCNHCGKEVSAKADGLRGHLEKCTGYNQASVSRRQSEPNVLPTLPKPVLVNKTRQTKVTGFVDSITKVEQEQLNLEIAKYIYSTNLSFSHVEHPSFRNLLHSFRPACLIPTRKMIGGGLLDKVHQNVIMERDENLFGKDVTVVQDGWKTRTAEPVIAHSVVTRDKSYFFNAVSTEYNVKSSKYCAMLLRETVQQLQEKGANVIAVVTDNCSSMEKMRRLIQEDNPKIFTYGCHAHLLNLVGRKFTPPDIMDKVQNVYTYFRNHDGAWSVLKQSKAGRPILPSNTRWNAWQDCFEYYLKNHAKMLETSRNEVAHVEDTEVLEILQDDHLYKSVQDTVKYMKPIQVALDLVQREKARLADGVHAWLSLRSALVIGDAKLQEYFDKQFRRALQPVGIAAYMLNPKYRGEGLEPELLTQGNSFLAAENPSFLVYAAQLHLKNPEYFAKEFFSEELLRNCSAVTWWTSQTALAKVSGAAIKFAVKLSQLPAGSADIERHFSTLGNIISVRRARLGMEKASKLCVIYRHFATDTELDDGDDWE